MIWGYPYFRKPPYHPPASLGSYSLSGIKIRQTTDWSTELDRSHTPFGLKIVWCWARDRDRQSGSHTPSGVASTVQPLPLLPLGPAKNWNLWSFQGCTMLIVQNWIIFHIQFHPRVQEAHSLAESKLSGNHSWVAGSSCARRKSKNLWTNRAQTTKFYHQALHWQSHIREGPHCCPSIRMIFPLKIENVHCQVWLRPNVYHLDPLSSDLAHMPHWQQFPFPTHVNNIWIVDC